MVGVRFNPITIRTRTGSYDSYEETDEKKVPLVAYVYTAKKKYFCRRT